MVYKVLFLVFAVGCYATPQQRTPVTQKYIRPCYPNDINCVRDNLAANSKCNKQVVGSIPSQYTVKTFRFETPFFNTSYIDNDLVVKNHDKCYVSEFFFNMESDTCVLAVDCPGLILTSNRTVIYHESLREDSVYSYTSTWEYPLIRMTTNIKNADAMDLCNSFVFTDVAAMPKFIVTPNNAPTKKFLSSDLSYLHIYERETFAYRGVRLFHHFVNAIICNFGCFA